MMTQKETGIKTTKAGRKIKQGLDYFMHDVDLSSDDKIELLEAECGLIGYAVFNKLLERIYRNGYYLEADERFLKVFCMRIGININDCINIINVCINEKIFNKKLYDEHKILTSVGIQKRYLKACERRKEINLDGKYLLLDEEDLSIYENINLKNGYKNPQGRKEVKEVKEIYGEFVLLTHEEYQRLLSDYGESQLKRMIDKLNNYLGADKKRLKKYTSHNHVLRGWVVEQLGIEKLNKRDGPGEFLTCRNTGQQFKKCEIKNGKCPICKEEIKNDPQ